MNVFQQSPRFDGVVFALDGTLVHSAPALAAALNVVLAEEGVAPFTVAEACRFIGAGAERLIGDAFTARERPLDAAQRRTLTERYVAAYAQRGSPDTALFAGASDVIDNLRRHGIPLAICTNKPEAIARHVLAQLKLDRCFVAIIGGDNEFGLKPAPGPLLEACRLMGVAPNRVLMIGDSGTDVRTARAATCTAAVVRHGYSRVAVESLGAAFVLDSLADVEALVLA